MIEKVGVSDSIAEDVANFSMDENNLIINFNNNTTEIIPLRSNNGEENEDWRGANIFITRKFLEIDMNN